MIVYAIDWGAYDGGMTGMWSGRDFDKDHMAPDDDDLERLIREVGLWYGLSGKYFVFDFLVYDWFGT